MCARIHVRMSAGMHLPVLVRVRDWKERTSDEGMMHECMQGFAMNVLNVPLTTLRRCLRPPLVAVHAGWRCNLHTSAAASLSCEMSQLLDLDRADESAHSFGCAPPVQCNSAQRIRLRFCAKNAGRLSAKDPARCDIPGP